MYYSDSGFVWQVLLLSSSGILEVVFMWSEWDSILFCSTQVVELYKKFSHLQSLGWYWCSQNTISQFGDGEMVLQVRCSGPVQVRSAWAALIHGMMIDGTTLWLAGDCKAQCISYVCYRCKVWSAKSFYYDCALHWPPAIHAIFWVALSSYASSLSPCCWCVEWHVENTQWGLELHTSFGVS